MTDERIARTGLIHGRHLERRQLDTFGPATIKHAVCTQRDDDVLLRTFARETFERAMRIGFARQRSGLDFVEQQQLDRVEPVCPTRARLPERC